MFLTFATSIGVSILVSWVIVFSGFASLAGPTSLPESWILAALFMTLCITNHELLQAPEDLVGLRRFVLLLDARCDPKTKLARHQKNSDKCDCDYSPAAGARSHMFFLLLTNFSKIPQILDIERVTGESFLRESWISSG